MSAVFTALATSVDGYITGPDPSPDQVVIHQVPVLLGGGTPLFQPGPTPATLQLRSVLPAPGVAHLHYDVQK